MAITIHYTIRLARATDIPTFLAAARSEARRRKWKIEPEGDDNTLTTLPHVKSEHLRFEFSKRLVCEEFVKTGFAPLKTHVAVIEFLQALRLLAKSMIVVDEGEYWDTGDLAQLKRLRAGFDAAFGKQPPAPDRSIEFTLGALTVATGPGGATKATKGPAKVIRVASAGKPAKSRAGKRRV